MYLDFHTHGKLAKYLPFSKEYTDWLFNEAKTFGLDALCLTEHFNTLGFDTLYSYIANYAKPDGDSVIYNGLRIFFGMETDIAEGGHVLCIGKIEPILELNKRLEPYKKKGNFLPAAKLFGLFSEYPVIVGAAHPFRAGGNIPALPEDILSRFDFIDLNGKDVAEKREFTEKSTYALGEKLGKPVVAGSDTHQAVQYGVIRTRFEKEVNTVSSLYEEMQLGRYEITISDNAANQVKSAALLKRALKEIDALGGDYVSLLVQSGESANILAKKNCIAKTAF